MFPWFEYLPVELHEKILSALSGVSLLAASKVCRLWNILAVRIAESKCENKIPSECILEIKEEPFCTRENVWLKAFSYYHQQQILIDNVVNYQVKYKFDLSSISYFCYEIYGSTLFLGCEYGKVKVYNAETDENQVIVLDCGNDSVRHLNVITSLKLLLVVTNKVEFYVLPDNEEKYFEMKKLQVSVDDRLIAQTDISFSISGTLMAVVSNPLRVNVFQLEMENENKINLKIFKSFQTRVRIQNVGIWDKEVLIVLHSGEILRWLMIPDKFTKTEKYSEICYSNPMSIYRNIIFCSTNISRKLLGLWHMDLGMEYWLMGKPNADLIRCSNFDCQFNNDEVLCVYLKQQLLFCGTNEGRILIYYLSDSFFNEEANEASFNEHLKTEFDRAPNFTITLNGNPIKSLKADFTSDKIFIVAWSCFKVQDLSFTPQFLIQCVEIS